jgi:hypothetical protein
MFSEKARVSSLRAFLRERFMFLLLAATLAYAWIK